MIIKNRDVFDSTFSDTIRNLSESIEITLHLQTSEITVDMKEALKLLFSKKIVRIYIDSQLCNSNNKKIKLCENL